MVGLISGVRKNSLAADAGIKAGEKLCSVDGVQVKDIIGDRGHRWHTPSGTYRKISG